MLHPNPETLHDYVIGKLPLELADEVERHLTLCEACEETVDRAELPREADSFVELLLSPDELEPFEDEPSLQRMLAKVEQILRVGSEATGDSYGAPRSASAFLEQRPPDRLGEYELGEALGSGGMGAVFRGFHRRLRRPVAIKLLKSDRVKDASAVERFEREMEAVGRLEHAHIVRALDAGETGGTLYLVMELADGMSLADVGARRGSLDVPNACEAVRQAALGIAAAHRAGMTHRDVKPGNLMLVRQPSDDGSPRAVVKVLDLGLARFHETVEDGSSELTGDGQVMGTIDYMAPEQAISSREAGPPADVYSLGATLYRLLTGRTPLDVDAKAGILQRLSALASRPAPPVRSLRAELPAALATLIDRTLSRDPQARPSAGNLISLLEPFAKGADLAALLAIAESDATTTDRELVPTIASKSAAVDTTGDLSLLNPTLPDLSGVQPPRSRARLWSLAAAGASLPMLLLGVILLLQTPKGTIRVEIDDPDVEVRVKGSGLLLSGPGEEETTIAAGDQALMVARGDFSFETDKFALRKGETILVRVELVDGGLRATADGKEIGRLEPPDVLVNSGASPMRVAAVDAASPDRGSTAVPNIVPRPDDPSIESPPAILATTSGPSPFDAFRHEDLTHEQLLIAGGGDPDAAPLELVKVYGDGRFSLSGAVTAWSPDGSLYVDYEIRRATLTDAATGVPVRTLAGLDWGPSDACFSRDGKTLWTGAGQEVPLVAHDVATGRLLWRRTRHEVHDVVTVVERPDGVSIVSGSWAGTADVWNGRTGERIGGFDAQLPNSAVAAFDATGRTAALIVRGESPAIELRDVDSGELLRTIPGSFAPISAAFDSAGTTLAAVAIDASGACSEIVLINTLDGTERKRIPYRPPFAPILRFAPDGALALADIGIRRLDVMTGEAEFSTGTGHVEFAFSADGRRLLAAAPWGAAMIYDWKTGIRSEDPAFSVARLDFANVSRSGEEIALVLSVAHRTEIRDVVTDAVDRFVPGRLAFATLSESGDLIGASVPGALYAMSRGKSLATRRIFAESLNADATRAAASPDGASLAVPAAKSVLILDASTGDTTATIELPHEPSFFAISLDNRYLAVTSWVKREVMIWRIADETLVRTLVVPEQLNSLGNLEFSPRGDQLAVASFDGPIVWTTEDDWKSNDPAVQQFRCDEGYVERISFRPDGARIAAAVDVGIRIWDPRKGSSDSSTLVRHSNVENKAVELKYVPDGRHILAKTRDGRAVVVRTEPRPFRPIAPESVGLAFDGKSTDVVTPAVWNGSSPMTFEAWLTPETTGTSRVFGSAIADLELWPWKTGFALRDSDGTYSSTSAPPLTSGRSVHLAAVYEDGEMRLYVGGRYASRQPLSSPLSPEAPFRLGCHIDGHLFYRGVMDEVRISSIARYKDDDFTPQRRFEPDAETIALYHMDEVEGDVLNDASGNGRHGEISNGTWIRSDLPASK